MNRTEHINWCKQRALEFLDKIKDDHPLTFAEEQEIKNNMRLAIASFASDMTKHPETKNHIGLQLLMTYMDSPSSLRRFINGFN